MEYVQVATCTGPKFVQVATCASQPIQVATCTKSQLVHNIFMIFDRQGTAKLVNSSLFRMVLRMVTR